MSQAPAQLLLASGNPKKLKELDALLGPLGIELLKPADVGGIPEVVSHGKTGLLVPFEPCSPTDAEPKKPHRLAIQLAGAIDTLMQSPEKQSVMGAAARRHVEKHFGWKRIAAQTLAAYAQLCG